MATQVASDDSKSINQRLAMEIRQMREDLVEEEKKKEKQLRPPELNQRQRKGRVPMQS